MPECAVRTFSVLHSLVPANVLPRLSSKLVSQPAPHYYFSRRLIVLQRRIYDGTLCRWPIPFANVRRTNVATVLAPRSFPEAARQAVVVIIGWQLSNPVVPPRAAGDLSVSARLRPVTCPTPFGSKSVKPTAQRNQPELRPPAESARMPPSVSRESGGARAVR